MRRLNEMDFLSKQFADCFDIFAFVETSH